MLTKLTFALLAVLVLGDGSAAAAQTYRQRSDTHRRAVGPNVPATSSYTSQTQNCNATYNGFRLCDWLRPDRD